MEKNNLISGKIYHVFNRGVDKRQIFLSDGDYSRFIRGLLVFNDNNPVLNFDKKFEAIYKSDKNSEPLVDVLAFCLMPNHFHLLLRQKIDGGIGKFMSKIGIGYANYFNLKYERGGTLFQGTFKAVSIDNESQFLYIPFYIHSNPLDLFSYDQGKKGISKAKQAMDFLNSYHWSSHSDYVGRSNFSFILEMNPLNEIFEGEEGYKKDFYEFVKSRDISNIKDILLDDETDSSKTGSLNRFVKPYFLGITLWISWGILRVFDNLDLLTGLWQ